MVSRVLNFIWLNLDLPAPLDPEDGSIREPLPKKYIENVRKAGAVHPSAQIVLWVDSQRLTLRQMDYLRLSIEDGRPNVHLQDLRTITAYDQEPLYNQAEINPDWRRSQDGLIWCQVDAAKVLVSLQGNFDQVFFADLDHAHLDIVSRQVQGALKKYGMFIGAAGLMIENQTWGFNRRRIDFFERYYATALESAHKSMNAWEDLIYQVKDELVRGEGIPLEKVCIHIEGDGSQAEQTGHQWRTGYGTQTTAPVLIPNRQLHEIFNKGRGDNQDDAPRGIRQKIRRKRGLAPK